MYNQLLLSLVVGTKSKNRRRKACDLVYFATETLQFICALLQSKRLEINTNCRFSGTPNNENNVDIIVMHCRLHT